MPISTVEERRKAIQGWVYSPYRMNDLMMGILGGYEDIIGKKIHLEIYDNSSYTNEAQLYNSKNTVTTKTDLTKRTVISFNDHKWFLQYIQDNSIFSSIDYSKVWYTAIGGTSISLLFFLLYLSLLTTNTRAKKLAAELTSDLNDSESKYSTIFRNEIYAVSIFDLDTLTFLDVNERYCSLYGYSKEELLAGMSILDTREKHELSDEFKEQVNNGDAIYIPLSSNKKKDGTIFPVEIVGGTYLLKGKKVMFMLANDITERKLVEKELENHRNNLEYLVEERTEELDLLNKELINQLEKERELEIQLQESLSKEKEINELKSKFITTVSHEFRTPLATLSSSTQMIQRYSKKWSEEKLNQHHKNIATTVKYITQLLDNVLSIGNIEKEILTNNPEEVNIEFFTQSIFEQLQPELTALHNLVFNNELDNPIVFIDKKLLTHVILNLLTNAIKYSPNGGDIELNISSENNCINIKVSDNGIGIPEDEIKHIYDAFYRAQNTPGINGTGIGLNIIKRAVDVLGGSISVDSKINEGSTFTVSIPNMDKPEITNCDMRKIWLKFKRLFSIINCSRKIK